VPSIEPVDDSVRSASSVLRSFLEHLAEVHGRRTVDSLATTELTLSQVRMLLVLRQKCEAISVNCLADAVGLSLAAAGRGVDRLVGIDLVDRREDAADRRVKRLSLTDKGTELIERQFELKEEDLNEVVTSLPADVRARLRDALSDALLHLSPEKVTS
jgi:DNA-binding MarR family transcriptional regulator